MIMEIEDCGIFPDGEDAAKYVCQSCGYKTGWIYSPESEWVSKDCPSCPQSEEQMDLFQ